MKLQSLAIVFLLASVGAGTACTSDPIDNVTAVIEVEPSRLEFVDLPGSIDGDPRALTIRNVGKGVLTVTALRVEDGPSDALDFPFDPSLTLPFDVSPGSDHVLMANYASTAWTTATLVIESNADNAPRREVPLALRHGDAPDGGPADAGGIDAGPIDAGPIDAGPIDAGSDPVDAGPADAGFVPDVSCAWQLDSDVEVGSTDDGVSDLAIAANSSGFTVGWWTDEQALGVRTVAKDGTPSGTARTVFSDTDARSAWALVGSADATGPVFVAMSESAFGKRLNRVDLRGAAPVADELDFAYDYFALTSTASSGGLATLYRSKGAGEGIWIQRDGGAHAFAKTDTALPSPDSSSHSLAPHGDGFVVAWHGKVGSESPVSGGLLDATGVYVDGSVQRLSIGGEKNVRPVIAPTSDGFTAAWMQDSTTKRSAVAGSFDALLRARTGDVVLGEMGPVGNSSGSVAAAAVGSQLAVAWTRFDANGAVLGFTLGGLSAGGTLHPTAQLQRTTLARYTDIALAASGDDVLVAFAQVDGATTHIHTAHARCE